MEQKKTSLYDLQALAFRTEIELEENGGELTPEIEAALATTESQIPTKIDAYKGYIDFLDSRVELLKSAIQEMQKKKRAVENAKEKVKDYVKQTMQSFGLDKIKGEVYTASLRETKSLKVEYSALDGFIDEKLKMDLPSWIDVEFKINKTELARFIKENGITPNGVSEETGTALTIR